MLFRSGFDDLGPVADLAKAQVRYRPEVVEAWLEANTVEVA